MKLNVAVHVFNLACFHNYVRLSEASFPAKETTSALTLLEENYPTLYRALSFGTLLTHLQWQHALGERKFCRRQTVRSS